MRLTRISIFLLLLSSLAVFGQTNRGGISGTISDSSGAAIPGAKVTITNAGTGQEVTLTTSDSGAFTANSLEPVTYTITVEAANFKKSVVSDVKVDTATIQTVNLALEAGNIAEQVTVEADAVLLNTESGTTGQTISERQLQELPLNNRSVLDLAVTAPNVSGDAGSEDPEVLSGQPVPGFNLSLNGGRPGSTSILADGVNNTGVGIARAVVSFTPETVQEFTVQTSAYSAEYGQTGGGVINATTKSGTNRLTGTALWYTRNPATNAQPYRIGTTPRTPNNLRYDQLSFSVGGPVFLPAFGEGGPMFYDGRNRTFFFAAVEPRYRQDFVTQTALVPTAAERAGDFRGLVRTVSGWLPASVAAQFNQTAVGTSAIYQQFTIQNGRYVPIVLTTLPGTTTSYQFCQFGDPRAVIINGQPQCTPANNATVIDSLNVLPQNFIDPIALKILQFQPKGGDYFLDNGVVRNYLVNRQVNQNETRYTVRLDHNITEANKVNFRYTLTPAIGVRDFGSDINGSTGVFSDASQYLLSDDHIFTPNIVNNLRLSYTKGVFSEDFSPEFSINGGRNLATELGLPSLTSGGIPLFQISGDGGSQTIGLNGYSALVDIGSSGSTNNYNKEERFSINDIVYWNRGNMGWKFGIELSQARLSVTPFFGASGGRYEFRVVNTSNNRGTGLTNGGNNLASLLIGVPNAVQVRPILLNYDYRWNSGAAFVQNDWKVRPNFTLNLGARYSLQYPRSEKNNLQGVFRPDLAQTRVLTEAERRATATGLGIATTAAIPSYVPTSVQLPVFAYAGRGGRSKYLVPVDYKAFEPRFGFAYSPKFMNLLEERNAVIRGGYGISHAPLTGNNRNPNPDFGSFQASSTLANGSTVGGTADPTQPVRLSGNPAAITSGQTLDQVLGVTSDGLIIGNSLGVPGFAYAGEGSGAVPYSQNWNLSFSMEVFKNTVLEFAYVGNRGVHLYTPLVNINPRDTSFVEFLEGQNIPAETAFADPLGRRNSLGAVITIQRNSVTSPYFGFNTLNRFFDPSANSIRHAGYVQLQSRFMRGLDFTANYTYGKSIDDASDASPDVRVLTTGSTLGQVYYGQPRSIDRAISTFDIKHNFSSTFVYSLPFGKRGYFFRDAPGFVNALIGGWSTSGVIRLQGGQPFLPFITDTNRLGGVNRSIRLDLVQGVPLINPRYSKSCSIGSGCEPYINPAAFMRPAKGSLGNAPRTLDVRAPMQEYFDFTLQKSFDLPFIGDEGKRRIAFRVDLINAFNHPNFRYVNTGNTPPGFGTLPTELTAENETVNGVTRAAVITAAEYNTWATANGQPLSTTTAGLAQLNQIRATVNAVRLTSGALPLDFFRQRLPEGFATTAATTFDIRTLEGFKLYRLRQTYDPNFGSLFAVINPRYIQFGIKVYF